MSADIPSWSPPSADIPSWSPPSADIPSWSPPSLDQQIGKYRRSSDAAAMFLNRYNPNKENDNMTTSNEPDLRAEQIALECLRERADERLRAKVSESAVEWADLLSMAADGDGMAWSRPGWRTAANPVTLYYAAAIKSGGRWWVTGDRSPSNADDIEMAAWLVSMGIESSEVTPITEGDKASTKVVTIDLSGFSDLIQDLLTKARDAEDAEDA